MTAVLCSAPIAVPVFRMRATVRCRDLGSPAHRAAQRLHQMNQTPEWIAAILGLRLDQTQNLLGQLDGSGGHGVRELLVWIDSAHKAVLTARDGLDIVAGARQRELVHLPLLPPRATDVDREAFTLAASALAGRSARIVVDEVRELVADHRPSRPFDHVLHLAGCDLVLRADRTLEVWWHDALDEQLTTAANRAFDDERFGPEWKLLTPLRGEQARASMLASCGLSPRDAYALGLDPSTIHERALALAHGAERQLVIAVDASLRRLPIWLEPAIRAARDREVDVRVVLANVRRWEDGRNAAQEADTASGGLPAGVSVIRDGDRALLHSSCVAFGAMATLTDLSSQAALDVHDPSAVRDLLRRLRLPVPDFRRRAAAQTADDVAVEQLRTALSDQERFVGRLPVEITAGDVRAFIELIDRYQVHLGDRRRVAQLAAGIAWERAVYTRCRSLSDEHPSLVVDALRWTPPAGRIDIDVVARDIDSRTLWIIDAKYDTPAGQHVSGAWRQLCLAKEHGLLQNGWRRRALIVYRPTREVPALTNHREVRRTTLARLSEALELA